MSLLLLLLILIRLLSCLRQPNASIRCGQSRRVDDGQKRDHRSCKQERLVAHSVSVLWLFVFGRLLVGSVVDLK
jgi:hypothetical protein